MVTKKDKNAQRLKRHKRVRGKISGTTERPRLAVYRSNANIYAQIIDDIKGVTLCSASTVRSSLQDSHAGYYSSSQVCCIELCDYFDI